MYNLIEVILKIYIHYYSTYYINVMIHIQTKGKIYVSKW